MSDPAFGFHSCSLRTENTDDMTFLDNFEAEVTAMRSAISAINRLRPRFVVITGGLTWSSTPAQFEEAKKSIARISETIPVLIVPGSSDIGTPPTLEGLARYRTNFGADFYGFWYSGVRCLVVNSSLLIYQDSLPEETLAHDLWLEEEIEQAKLCSTHLLIFSHHPWRPAVSQYPDAGYRYPFASNIMPAEVADKWLKQLRHEKVNRKRSSIAIITDYKIYFNFFMIRSRQYFLDIAYRTQNIWPFHVLNHMLRIGIGMEQVHLIYNRSIHFLVIPS